MRISIKDKKKLVTSPEVVHDLLQAVLKKESPEDQDKEHFWVFLLNADCTIKALDLVTLGTLNQTPIHPREVFTRAVSERCAAVLVAHNHPSHNLKPSSEDIQATRALVDAGKILDIDVYDHIITTQDGYTSFRAEGLLF